MWGTETTKTDKDCIILTADKGVVLGLMDRQDYIKKARNTYKPILTGPTKKHKEKLINILKNKMVESEMNENTYKKIYN